MRPVLLAVVVLLVWSAGAVHAAVLTVTKIADTDGVCNPGDCSLREAIKDANAAADGDQIVFASGLSGTIVLGASLPKIVEAVDIVGPGAGLLAVSANGNAFSIFDVTAPGGAHVSISGLTITGVVADNRNAVRVLSPATAALSELEIRGNQSATGSGLNTTSVVAVTNSTIAGNTTTAAGIVGGAGVLAGLGSSVLLTNTTVSGNTASGDIAGDDAHGGGLWIDPAGFLQASNSTIALNSVAGVASSGGGISGNATLTNTLVADNGAPVGPDCSGTVTGIGGHNLIEQISGCGFAGDTSGNVLGQDPLLAPLAQNGGSTRTQAITTASPAFNAGTNTGCPSADQRGVSRPQDAVCDIGAFELTLPLDTTAPTLDRLTVTKRILPSSKATPTDAAARHTKRKQRRKRGGKISYMLSEQARVAITVQARLSGLKRTTKGATRCVKRSKKTFRRLKRQLRRRLVKRGLRGSRLQRALLRALRRSRCARYVTKGVLNRDGRAGENRIVFSGRIGKRRLRVGRYRITALATDAAGNSSKPASKTFRIIS